MATKKATVPATHIETPDEAAKAAKRKAAAEKAARTRAANAAKRQAAKAAKEVAEKGEAVGAAVTEAATVAASKVEVTRVEAQKKTEPSVSAPKPTVSVEPELEPTLTAAPAEQSKEATPEVAAVVGEQNASTQGIFKRVNAWLDDTFPASKNAVLGGLTGLLIALLFFAIGFGKTLFIVVLVVVGVAIGQFADGDPKIANAVHKLTKKR